MIKRKSLILLPIMFLVSCTSPTVDSSKKDVTPSTPTSSNVTSSSNKTSSSQSSSSNEEDKVNPKIVIDQVMGIKDKESPVSHAFIELYNTEDKDVDLSSFAIQYQEGKSKGDGSWVSQPLTGIIKAHDYYLIRGKASETPAPDLLWNVPEGDIEWDKAFSNKGFSVALTADHNVLTQKNGAFTDSKVIDLAGFATNDWGKDKSNGEEPYTFEKEFGGVISKKKGAIRKNHQDTEDNKNDFEAIDYSSDVEDNKLVRNGKGQVATKVEVAPTSPAKIEGFNNNASSLQVESFSRFDSRKSSADGGSEEIVAYDEVNQTSYTVNGLLGQLSVVSFTGDNIKDGGKNIVEQNGTWVDIKKLTQDLDSTFTYGDMTSVAVSPDGTKVVLSLQDQDYSKEGRIALFEADSKGNLSSPKLFKTGVQPDCIKFSPDGKYVLTADEGEPREGYGKDIVDPKGSVTVLDVAKGNSVSIDFTSFDAKREDLVKKNIILKKETAPSLDLEPEYIAILGNKAYVTLQENNAIATLNLDTKAFERIDSVGFEDYSKVTIDLDDTDKKAVQKNYPNTLGVRMPDGVSSAAIGGKNYLFTANEGDAREWGDEKKGTYYTTETKKKTLEASDKSSSGKIKLVDSSSQDGLDATKNYLFGSRSFTAFEIQQDGALKEVYDSKSEFESKTFEYLPKYYNSSNDDLEVESRTLKKGVEPESVTVGTVGSKTYAFITLERIGGIMIYDITDLGNGSGSFANYINSRDFSTALGADDSPEGIAFVSSQKSPVKRKALLLAACEVGGTLASYTLEEKK